jgi:glucosylceramidase
MQPNNATMNNRTPGRRRPRMYAAMKPVCRILAPALLTVLFGCAGAVRHPARAQRSTSTGQGVHVWVTTANRSQQLARATDLEFGGVTSAPATIEIDTTRRYQTMIGFGAAITDASAWLIRSRMSGAQRAALMQELFGPAPALGISFVRLTIGASDFSPAHYSLDDMPDGETDPALAHFSIAPIQDTVVPVVRDALSLNPSLRVMASPWSAPGWMKTSGALIHGTLLPQFYGAFASYLFKYLDAMQAQAIPIYALTMQNEPHFDTHDYPGMLLDADARAQLIGKYLGRALARRTPPTRILEWDHNWDRPQEPLQVLGNPLAAAFIAGVAWHCYAGNVAAQTQVHLAHPDKDAYLTECSGGDWGPPSDPRLLQMTRELIVGSTRGWARGVLLWNLALDQSAGPHLGGCATCRGLVTIDSRTGEVTRNDDYYVIAHASRFVRPGAQRVESNETDLGIANVAFQNADDGSIVLIAANSAPSPRALSVRCRDREFRYTMPGESVATFVWAPRDAVRYN